MLVVKSGSQSVFQFSPKMLDEVKLRARSSSTPNWELLTSPCAQGHHHGEAGKGLAQIVDTDGNTLLCKTKKWEKH